MFSWNWSSHEKYALETWNNHENLKWISLYQMKKNNAFETRDTGNKGLSGIKTEGAVMRACGPLALNTCGLPQMSAFAFETWMYTVNQFHCLRIQHPLLHPHPGPVPTGVVEYLSHSSLFQGMMALPGKERRGVLLLPHPFSPSAAKSL